MSNAELITRLYSGLDAHDGETMAACYLPTAVFEDPAFGLLVGEEVGAMWKMLTGRAEDLRVRLVEHEADEETGSAHWIANYTFAQTGRAVENDIRASFRFAEGLIAEHRDSFDLRRWARQALGTQGSVLALTPLLGPAIRRRTRGQLDAYMGRT